MKILTTTSKIRFGLLGEKGPSPAPTVFAFAGSVEDALTLPQFNQCALLLQKQGCLCVSVDLPAFGQDIREGDSGDPSGTRVPFDWQARLERGEPLVADFTRRASAVLDHLLREGYSDPANIGVYGISRGAFMGLQFAAADPRVRFVAAFAPLVDFLSLREHAGLENHPALKSVALIHQAEKLAGRSIWICVGNDDDRVDTDRVIAFARKTTLASIARNKNQPGDRKPVDIELHILPVIGHGLPPSAPEEGASWIARRLSTP